MKLLNDPAKQPPPLPYEKRETATGLPYGIVKDGSKNTGENHE